MSHSRRKTPIAGITTARSDKAWKRAGHKALRRDMSAMRLREVCDVWGSPKEGKRWHSHPRRFCDPHVLRK